MNIHKILAPLVFLSLWGMSEPIVAASNPTLFKAINTNIGNSSRLEYVHRRYYYRYPPPRYYRHGYGYWNRGPYYYRPYYYGYPRHGYIGPNYGYYGYPYYRRWYGPGVHLHFGW